VHAALGSPFGFGIEGEHFFTGRFSIAAGGGPKPGGAEVALITRLRFPLGGLALGVGAGVSYGFYSFPGLPVFDNTSIEDAVSVVGEAFIEKRMSSGFFVRGYVSPGVTVAGDRCTMSDLEGSEPCESAGHARFGGGVALGFAF
jgi:hypothetical protein